MLRRISSLGTPTISANRALAISLKSKLTSAVECERRQSLKAAEIGVQTPYVRPIRLVELRVWALCS